MGSTKDFELQSRRTICSRHYRKLLFFPGVDQADGQAQENGQYELVPLPKATGATASDGKDVPSDGKKGTGYSAIFVARNRLAVLDKVGQVCLCYWTCSLT